MKKKIAHFCYAFLGGILLLILTSPLYSNSALMHSIISTTNVEATRIDIYNLGSPNNKIKILSLPTTGTKYNYPKWCQTKNGQCSTITITNFNSPVTFKIQAQESGNIAINIMGPDIRYQDKRYPVFVDYTDFIVNGQKVFSDTQTTFHDEPYKYQIKANDGDIIEVTITAHRHLFGLSDLKYFGINYLRIISIILIYIVFLTLLSWYRKNKSISFENKNDFYLIIVFFTLLLIPSIRITNEAISEQENRKLSELPQSISQDFGRSFESWFNDRFFGRSYMLNIYSDLIYSINNTVNNPKAIYDKSSGWMFNTPYIFNEVSSNSTKGTISGIQAFDEFCKSNGIKLYVLVVPLKSFIYKDELNKFIYENRYDGYEKYIQQIESALDNGRVINPDKKLIEAAKQDYVFFKTSHHWTDWGAYTGYNALMDKIERDFPRIKRVNINDYDKNTSNLVRDDWGRYFLFGHTISTLNLVSRANEILDTNYIYYDNRNPIEITAKDLSKYKHKDFYYKNGANYKILMIGTSQNENLSVFLPYTVQHTKYIRLNNVKNMIYNEQLKVVKNYGDKILQFDPDIIVLTITYDNLPTLADLAVKD